MRMNDQCSIRLAGSMLERARWEIWLSATPVERLVQAIERAQDAPIDEMSQNYRERCAAAIVECQEAWGLQLSCWCRALLLRCHARVQRRQHRVACHQHKERMHQTNRGAQPPGRAAPTLEGRG